MAKDRIIEEYRQCKLLSAFHGGKYKGRVWQGDELLTETEGIGIQEILQELRAFVDQRFIKIENSRTVDPDVAEYIKAFQSMLPSLPDSHLAMLKAHYSAPNHELTATQLASSAGYKKFGAANLQYGIVGRKLYELVPTPLLKKKDGTPIFTSALATGDIEGPEKHWLWKLKPPIVEAIAQLGLSRRA